MRWPFWFPYPSSWLRALVLHVALVPIAAILGKITFFLTMLPVGSLGAILSNGSGPDDGTDTLIMLWVTLFVGIVPIYFFAQADRLLWNRDTTEKMSVIPHWRNVLEGAFVWTLFFWGMFVIAFLLMDYLREGRFYGSGLFSHRVKVAYIWVFIHSAFGFQVRFLILRALENRRKRRNVKAHKRTLPKAKRPMKYHQSPPLSPVDKELEDLKRQMRDKSQ